MEVRIEFWLQRKIDPAASTVMRFDRERNLADPPKGRIRTLNLRRPAIRSHTSHSPELARLEAEENGLVRRTPFEDLDAEAFAEFEIGIPRERPDLVPAGRSA